MAIRGILRSGLKGRNHIITLAIEHKCVLETVHQLREEGYFVTLISVGRNGLPDLGELDGAFRAETALVCSMYANNETGVILPVREIAALSKLHHVPFFCDATQGTGKTEVDVSKDGMDMMAFTAHKMYGPKGIGALYIRGGLHTANLRPLISGGSHEQGMRGGTLNVPGIVGFGEAARLCRMNQAAESGRISEQQKYMEDGLLKVPGVILNGDVQQRLPHITNISIEGIDNERLLLHLSSKLALGSGSACSSITREPSHVLRAMGIEGDLLNGSIRISRGRFTTQEQIEFATEEIVRAISRLRNESATD
jgi:cysteine desulfurase